MADNVSVTPGSGASIAADDVSSVYFQKIKVDAGGDGVSVPINDVNDGLCYALPVVSSPLVSLARALSAHLSGRAIPW